MIATQPRISRYLVLALLAALAAFAATALAPGSASAQSAFCQQYPNDPSCLDEGGGGGDDDDDDDDAVGVGPGAGVATGTGDPSGNLPFTGYPLSPLILLLLALLAIGLTVRTYIAIRDRMRGRRAVAGSPLDFP